MVLPEFDLTGKRALITGAGRGIGKGIALVLAEAGADVAVTGLTESRVAGVADEIRQLHRRGLGIVSDATNEEEADALAKRVLSEFGGLDILVNCVGDTLKKLNVASRPGKADPTMTKADWLEVMDINLTQAFLGCRAFGPHLLEQGRGSVINISAFAAFRAMPRRSAYTAGKAGLIGFTRALALEWAPHGVRVNAIAPGLIADFEQVTEEDVRKTEEHWPMPLGRFGKLREVGLMALYLASDASSYVTGQTFAIDGGYTIDSMVK